MKKILVPILFLAWTSMSAQDTAAIKTQMEFFSSNWQAVNDLPPEHTTTRFFRPDGQLDSLVRMPGHFHIIHKNVHLYDAQGRDTLRFDVTDKGERRHLVRTTYPSPEVTQEWTRPYGKWQVNKNLEYKNGLLVSGTDRFQGRRFKYLYDQEGNLKEVVEYDHEWKKLGTIQKIKFDEKKYRWQVSNLELNGKVYQRYYFQDAKLTRPLLKEYLEGGKVSSKITFSYRSEGKLYGWLQKDEESGVRNEMTFRYNEQGHFIEKKATSSTSDPEFGREEIETNAQGRIVSRKVFGRDKKLFQIEKNEFNSEGNLIRKTIREKGKWVLDHRFTYNLRGRLATQKLILGNTRRPNSEHHIPDDQRFRFADYVQNPTDSIGQLEFEYNQSDSLHKIWWVGQLPPIPRFFGADMIDRLFNIGSPQWVDLNYQGLEIDTLTHSVRGDTAPFVLAYLRPEGGDTVIRRVWRTQNRVNHITEADPSGRINLIWHHPSYKIPLKTLMAYSVFQNGDTLIKRTFQRPLISLKSQPFALYQTERFFKSQKTQSTLPGFPDHFSRNIYNPEGKLVQTDLVEPERAAHKRFTYNEKGQLQTIRNYDVLGQLNRIHRYEYLKPGQITIHFETNNPAEYQYIYSYTYY